ncbi:hypothetical protein [Cupriavidus sp. HPC(L)]|nr:hypothetical protein [Cupriavidus sp. HPC(L)]
MGASVANAEIAAVPTTTAAQVRSQRWRKAWGNEIGMVQVVL